MSGKSANKAAPSNGAPQWLIQAGMQGGWVGKDGKAAPVGKPGPAKKPTTTDNGKGYVAAQGLKGVTRGSTEGPYGLRLSDAPPLATKGEGIKMDHGIRTIGQGKATTLLAAHAPKFGQHHAKAPVFRYNPDVSRAGSNPSRAAGPKPKAAPKVHTPDASLKPDGVVRGDRTYALVGSDGNKIGTEA